MGLEPGAQSIMNGERQLNDASHFRSGAVGASLLAYATLGSDSRHRRRCRNNSFSCQASPSLDRPREDSPVVCKLCGPILLPR